MSLTEGGYRRGVFIYRLICDRKGVLIQGGMHIDLFTKGY